MPTSEEQSDHLQETIAASDENDPFADIFESDSCLLYTSPSPRDQ